MSIGGPEKLKGGARAGIGAVAVFGFLSACGGGKSPPLDSAASCGDNWQTVLTLPGFDVTSPLAYGDGVLYYSSLTARTLTALTTSGGAGTILGTDFAPELWLEADQLVYTGGNTGNLVSSLPVAGGSPTVLLDSAANRPTSGIVLHHAFNATDFYWTEETALDGPTTVWRASRSGGTPVQIGSVIPIDPVATQNVLPVMDIALDNDAVLLGASMGVAYAVPFDGSGARQLATIDPVSAANLAGLDPAGVYWSLPRAGASREGHEWSVDLAPADGSPVRTFWQGLPDDAGVAGMWPIGDGGWALAINQLFDDSKTHLGIWLLAADGKSRRLACSPPGTPYDLPAIEARPAVAPDAIYFFVAAGEQTRIVRVPR